MKSSFTKSWLASGAGVVMCAILAGCGGSAAPGPSGSTQPAVAGTASKPSGGQSAAAAAGLTPAQQTLYDAAKKEGEVIWQAGVLDQAADPIGKAFTAKFPGIKVSFNPINEPQVPAQVITEASSGSKVVKSVDLAHGSPTQFKPLLDRDLLLSADWASYGVDPSRVQVDGKWVINEDSVNLWIYNTQQVSAADVPKQWDDLLKPRFKGKKIVTNASAAGLSQLFLTMGDEKARAFLTALKDQDLVATKSKGPAREMITNGQAHLGISTVKDMVDLKKKGAPVDGVPALGPMERDERGWYIPKGVQHPNAAQLFVTWLVSDDGWKQQQKAGLDIATPCGVSEVAKYVCDSGLKYTDPKSAGLDLFAYYDKLDSYQDVAREVLQLKPQ